MSFSSPRPLVFLVFTLAALAAVLSMPLQPGLPAQPASASATHTTYLSMAFLNRSIPVRGTIAEDTTWKRNTSYAIQGDLTVAPGVALTIESGVQIFFNGDYVLSVGGTLIADGTQAQPVRFMGATPAITDWHIIFENTSQDARTDPPAVYHSGNLLRWVILEGSGAMGIGCNYSSVYFSHLTIHPGGISCFVGATPLWLLDSQVTGYTGLISNAFTNQLSQAEAAAPERAGNEVYVYNTSITRGDLSIGAQAEVYNSTVNGKLNAWDASHISHTTSNGVEMFGFKSGLVENSTIHGRLTVNSGQAVSNTISEGLYITDGGYARGNTISTSLDWAIMTNGSVTLERNRVLAGSPGIYFNGGTLRENLVANTSGSGVEVHGDAAILSNTFSGIAGSAILFKEGSNFILDGNNFAYNPGSYDVEDRIPATALPYLVAPNNWWGTPDSAAIAQRIYDFYDDYTLGKVSFLPSLGAPAAGAPAYVSTVNVYPRPAGLGTATIDVQFSQAMDTARIPSINIQLDQANPLCSGTWTARRNMIMPRSNFGAATAANGKIYAIGGGYFETGWGLVTVEEYDPVTDNWIARTNMPTGRDGLAVAAASNGKIYAIGGAGANGTLGVVEEYDPEKDTWTSRTSMPTPRAYLSAAAANNGKIYAIGGYILNTGEYLSKVEEYDPYSDTWTARADMPSPRAFPNAVTGTNGNIYVMGGELGYSVDMVEEYNPQTNTWRSRSKMSAPRSRFGATAVSNGKIYAIGGMAMGLSDLNEEYDPLTDTWITRTNLPSPREGLSVVAANNGKVYAIGGAPEVQEFTPSNPGCDVRPLTGAWISSQILRATFEITRAVPPGIYHIAIQDAYSPDGMLIAPNTSYSFTVNYAGK